MKQLSKSSNESVVTESENQDYDKLIAEITNSMLSKDQINSSDEYPADEAKNNLS